MKGFKKLALAAAVASLPAAGLAMQPMADEEMSGVTGQDGISINLNANMSMDIGFEDTTGLGAYELVPETAPGAGDEITAVNAGMIYLPNFSVSGEIDIDIDAGARGTGVGGDGVLLLRVSVPALSIGDSGDPTNNFELYVEGSGLDNPTDNGAFAAEQRDPALALGRLDAVETVADGKAPIVSIGGITLTDMVLDIQLGDGAENLLAITSATEFNIAATDIVIRDLSTSGSGSVVINGMLIQNINLEGTTVSVIDDVDGAGLQIVAPANPDMGIALTGVGFQNYDLDNPVSSVLGNVLIGNVNMAGTTVTITGR